MRTYRKTWLRTWTWREYLGLLCLLVFGLCLYLEQSQNALAEQVIRLHVLANSDSQEDQALKLRVRDEILTAVDTLEDESLTAFAEDAQAQLPALEQIAERVLRAEGCADSVAVSLENTWFPTRHYPNFSLPAGEYRALRVCIGEAKGQNWWCVAFPPLCSAVTQEEVTDLSQEAGLTDQSVFLMLEDSAPYVIRFQAVEWWEELKHHFA